MVKRKIQELEGERLEFANMIQVIDKDLAFTEDPRNVDEEYPFTRQELINTRQCVQVRGGTGRIPGMVTNLKS